MTERIHKSRPQPQKTEEKVDETVASKEEERQKHLDDIDALIDEMDEILEENASEFVKSYIQKGGQ